MSKLNVNKYSHKAYVHLDAGCPTPKAAHSYKTIKHALRAGNTIRNCNYQLGACHGPNQFKELSNTYDCSSSIAHILYKTNIHQWHIHTTNPCSWDFAHFGSRGLGNLQAAINIYYNNEHVFMEMVWEGAKIVWDNPGSKRMGYGSCWAGTSAYRHPYHSSDYGSYKHRHVSGLGF